MSAIGSACPDLADSLARAHLRGAGTASGAGEGWRKAEPCRGGGGVGGGVHGVRSACRLRSANERHMGKKRRGGTSEAERKEADAYWADGNESASASGIRRDGEVQGSEEDAREEIQEEEEDRGIEEAASATEEEATTT